MKLFKVKKQVASGEKKVILPRKKVVQNINREGKTILQKVPVDVFVEGSLPKDISSFATQVDVHESNIVTRDTKEDKGQRIIIDVREGRKVIVGVVLKLSELESIEGLRVFNDAKAKAESKALESLSKQAQPDSYSKSEVDDLIAKAVEKALAAKKTK